MITKGSENFGQSRLPCLLLRGNYADFSSFKALEGANPSAEGEDADDGGDDTKVTVLDLADQFRLQKIEGGMSKKAYQAELKSLSHIQH